MAGTGTGGFSGNGGAATSAKLDDPAAVAVDPNGNLVIADEANEQIRVVATTTGTYYDGVSMTAQDIYTVAGNGTVGDTGDGGLATSAEICKPTGVATDTGGDMLVADCDSKIRMVPASTGVYFGTALTAGDVYTVAGNGTAGFSATGLATSAELDQPGGVAEDSNGNLIIADTANCRIRVVAQTAGTYYGVTMGTVGDIYTVAGNGTCGDTAGGMVATSAKLDEPKDVVVDGNGNLVIADTLACRIKVVAGSSGSYYGVSMMAGHIYAVTGTMCGNSGDGHAATSAEIDDPAAVAIDGIGNLVIDDTGAQHIQVVAESTGTYYQKPMTAGDIYTVAGTPNTPGYTGDGGAATSAEIDSSMGIAVDPAGNLVIADTDNDVVRVVAESTATFYGVAMTAR